MIKQRYSILILFIITVASFNSCAVHAPSKTCEGKNIKMNSKYYSTYFYKHKGKWPHNTFKLLTDDSIASKYDQFIILKKGRLAFLLQLEKYKYLRINIKIIKENHYIKTDKLDFYRRTWPGLTETDFLIKKDSLVNLTNGDVYKYSR